ncbi:MAG TPA: hypothetical protein VLL08_03400 [Kineosporiaceae bacterium]|nr:hypothetical protein [Kineosporiaceae bacterium]
MRTRVIGRVAIGGLSAVLALGGVIVGFVGPASAATACDPENRSPYADIDGDDSADVAVGMPFYQDGSGAVDVRFTGSPSVLLRSGDLGAGTGEGDSFGAEIAIADLDRDGCADMVISAPAEGQSAASDGAGNNEGQVHLVFGKPGGIDTSTSIVLPHDSSNLDHFGVALALVPRYDAALSQNVHDLYVGAPRATVNGHELAGEVFRYTIAPKSGGGVTATLREVRSQDSSGVPGSAEDGDGFGSVLAATDAGGVLVGAPEEKVGSLRDAGAAWFLRVNAAGAPIASQSWSQNSAGVPGSAETDDRFGSVLGSRGNRAVVGVPDEDSGSHADTGMIQTFALASTGKFSVGKAITQDTPGIPGTMEAGDRFGSAVVLGVALICQEAVDVAVGAAGEDVGAKENAGTISLIPLETDMGCTAAALRQGSGLAGAAEAGDEVGTVLGITRGALDAEEDYSDRLLVGVPSEDIGAVTDAGMVQPAHGGIRANGVLTATLQFSKGYLLTNDYGMVLPTTSN